MESYQGVLHETESAERENTNSRHGVTSPVPVDVHLQGLMENTISTISDQIIIVLTYPLIVSLSTRSLKSPGCLGTMLSSSLGPLA